MAAEVERKRQADTNFGCRTTGVSLVWVNWTSKCTCLLDVGIQRSEKSRLKQPIYEWSAHRWCKHTVGTIKYHKKKVTFLVARYLNVSWCASSWPLLSPFFSCKWGHSTFLAFGVDPYGRNKKNFFFFKYSLKKAIETLGRDTRNKGRWGCGQGCQRQVSLPHASVLNLPQKLWTMGFPLIEWDWVSAAWWNGAWDRI